MAGSTRTLKKKVSPMARRAKRPRNLYVVLPAYNEAENLGELLERIHQTFEEDPIPYEVIVVDDGSRDNTRTVAERYSKWMPVTVHAHEVNQGLGATIRDGLLAAIEKCGDDDIIIAMDADNTHPPGLMTSLIRQIKEGNDVVVASRFRPGACVRGVPLSRRWLSIAASLVFRLTFRIPGIRDYTCGYRAYRGAALKRGLQVHGNAFFSQNGFESMVDILLRLRNLDLVFGEAPLVLRYDFKRGESKMNVLRTVGRSLTLVLKRKFFG